MTRINLRDPKAEYARIVARYGPHAWAWPDAVRRRVEDDPELRVLVPLRPTCPDC